MNDLSKLEKLTRITLMQGVEGYCDFVKLSDVEPIIERLCAEIETLKKANEKQTAMIEPETKSNSSCHHRFSKFDGDNWVCTVCGKVDDKH